VTHEPDIARYAMRAIEFRDGKIRRDQEIEERQIAREVLPTLPSLEDADAEEAEEESKVAPGESPAKAPA